MNGINTLSDLFASNGFIPHGYCLTWSPTLLWLHVVSDSLIVLSYYSILLTLAYFIRKRPDLPYKWLFVLFGLFIFACGTTHLLGAITIWIPLYWLDGIAKGLTAIVSVASAALMFWVIPRALLLRRPAQLEAEIKERKFAQATSEEALDRLNKIASQVPGVVFQFRLRPDGSSCVPYASEGLHSIYRLSPDEVQEDAAKVFAVVHPEDLPRHLTSIQASAKDLSHWNNEYRLKFDGEPDVWLAGNATPQKEADGSVLWHGFINNITEHKMAENILAAKEQRYRTLVEYSPFCIHEIDMEGRIQSMNQAGLDMLGLDNEKKVCGVPYLNAVNERDNGRIKALMQDAFNGSSSHFEFTGAGDVASFFKSCFIPIYDTDGKVTELMGLTEDITERKNAEQILRENERNLREAQSIGRIGSYTFDIVRDAWKSSSMMDEIFGIDLDYPRTLASWVQILHSSERVRMNSYFREIIAEHQRFEREYRIVRINDGIERWVLGLGEIEYDKNGAPTLMRGIIQDITERKRQESLQSFRLKLIEMAPHVDHLSLMRATLDKAEELTGSSIGFFHYIEKDQETISLQTWSTNTLQNMCKAEGAGQHYPVSQAGVWADAIRTKQPAIQNDYLHLEGKKGMPEGHAPVSRFVSIPVIRNDKIVAMIGIGNKQTNYVATDVETTSKLADTVFDVIQSNRTQQLLRDSEEKFRKISESAQDAIIMMGVDECISEWNPAAERLFGYNAVEAIGQELHPLIAPPEAHQPFKLGFQHFLKTGGGPIIGKVSEVMAIRKGGEIFPVEVSLSSIKKLILPHK